MEQVALIYKFLVLSNLITQLNTTVENFGMPPTGVTHPRQLQEWDVWIFEGRSIQDELSAYIRTDKYNLTFGLGRTSLTRLNTNGVEFWPDPYSDQGTSSTNVSTELAYKLATNWLALANIDVLSLEIKYKPNIKQKYCRAKGESLVSPNFVVEWGGQRTANWKPGELETEPAATVQLDAARRWFVSFKLTDLSLYRGASPLGTNAWALSLLPDEPVRQMLTKPGVEYTNTFVLLQTSSDYERARRKRLMAELDRLVHVMEMDTVDLRTENFDTAYVNPPAFGLGGAFRSAQMTAIFNPVGVIGELDYLPRPYTNALLLMQEPSLLNSNQLYSIAHQKLTALGANWERIGQELKFSAEQRQLTYHQRGSRLEKPTAEYRFYWGKLPPNQGSSELQVSVNGAIKRIVRLAVADSSYFHDSLATTNDMRAQEK
jgi:hypothetical protein